MCDIVDFVLQLKYYFFKNHEIDQPMSHEKISYNIAFSKRVDTKAFMYTLIHDGHYHQSMVDGILLKCLGEDQARVVAGEVHEGICGTH